MSHPTAAQLFDPSNQQFTAERIALIRQMRSDAPVTFQPALHVYAMWQAMSVQPTKPLEAIFQERSANGNDEQKLANLLHSV